MKKKFILYPAVGLLLYVLLSSYSEGPDYWGNVDGTGATNPGGCDCHGPAGASSVTTTVALELDSAGIAVSHYTGGHTYTIKITGTNSTGLTWFGFQLCVIKTGTSGGGAINEGSFATTGLPTSTHFVAAGTAGVIGGSGLPIAFVEHSAAINSASPYIESFSWTAPAAGTGSITIYGAINAVNDDRAADAGDLWNNNNVTICENVSSITGTSTICPGATSTLSDATTGGTWSSGTTSVATVTSSGIVTGVTAGTVVISYNAGCSGTATTTVTVNSPSSITGTLSVCQGSTTPLTGGSGTWTSSATGVATVGATGIVTGVVTGSTSPATTSITFTPTTGCPAISIVTVNPLPAAIAGTASVCQGSTTVLTETTTGGTWSSGSTAIATINSSGVVTGVSTGSTSPATSIITYTSSSGCVRTITVTVNPVPASITGATDVCQGATTTLVETTTGGTWSSTSTSIATVNSSGVVTGVVTGSTSPAITVITFTSNGCSTSTTVTVNAATPAISGTTSICSGTSTTLSDASTGGTWSSSSTTVASIGLASGLLTGGASPGGTANISYTSLAGCPVTTTVTINPIPAIITGTTTICAGTTSVLNDGTTGGTWSSSNTTIATIGVSSGLLTGNPGPGGNSIITYTASGCTASTTITVNPSPPAITGTFSICAGTTTALNDVTTGGTWSSSNTTVGTVGLSSGAFTGNPGPGGTSIITYTAGTGCPITTTVTVNPLPPAITGTMTLCSEATSVLNEATTGGTWSSSNTGNATVTGTGTVTGAGTGGTSIISYTASGCTTTAIVTVNSLPPAITGTFSICAGATTTLNDATTSGTWNSSNTAVATIGLGTGLLTGGAGARGTAIVTYTSPAGCTVTTTVTINPLPPGITGIFAVCAGATSTLNDDVITGGTWSSSNTTAATVGVTSGTVAAVAGPGGTTIITYTTIPGCTTTATVTVNPLPSSITGTATVCSGASVTLNDATTGGTWSSGNTGVATVLPGAGSITGVGSGGTATITYALGTGCQASIIATVNPLPPTIGGTASVCVGLTSTLTDTTSGGTWTSNNTAVATVVTGTGVVTGVIANTASVTYTSPPGCTTSRIVTVNALPSVISGTMSVCAGLTTTLVNTTTGGTWSSSNTSVASVGLSSGIVGGIAPGTAAITYSVGAGCTVNATITVNALSPITGPTSLCTGSTATLADATTGGTWTSGTTSVGTIVAGSGLVTAVSPGNTTITYTLSSGCTASTTVTVVSTPSPIGGTLNVCAGVSTVLTDPGGGTWTSSNTGVATVISGTGAGTVFGVINGTSVITYSLGTSCNANAIVTVNALPGAIGGTLNACVGSTTLLSDGTTGGTWSSNATSIATIGLSSGTVTGVTANTSIIVYTSAAGCIRTAIVTINPLPAGITGAGSLCIGGTTSLGEPAGGTWVSSSTGTATISGTGVVSGIAPGTTTITYTAPLTGCTATMVVTVNSSTPSISGPSTVCIGATAILTDAASGGAWSTSATTVATVGSGTGIVSGVISGPVTITYSLGAGCTVSKIISVDPLPSAISGPIVVCAGSSISLSDGSTGGTWSSSNTSIATILPGSSSVASVSAGVDTIFYTVTSTGCARALSITVNPIPASISGPTSICLGSTSALTDGSTGGTWSSSATLVASVGLTTGLVNSLSPGPATITYKLPTGCLTTSIVTVNAAPAAITGVATACAGSTATLIDGTTGGTWSSSNTGFATVLPSSGMITGIAPGTDTITYTALTRCTRSITITINPSPSAISGATAICSGSTTLLTDGVTGGTWSSSATGIATVGLTTGSVTGGTGSGPTTITYKLSSGCSATTILTVNPLPTVISGAASVCTGATTALIDATSSGTWSSSNTSVATIDGSGTVTGIIPGTTTIAYTTGSGCARTINVTVNVVPSAITGTTVVCAGSTTALADGMTGGTWSSGTTSVATSTSGTGTITGVLGGTAVIEYTLAGCSTSTLVTVNSLPLAITGTTALCAGSTTALIDGTTGGTWSSDGTGTATIDAASGDVTGLASGSVTISYTLGTGCAATQTIIINALPLAVTGTVTVCTGVTTLLSDGTTPGTWSSSATAVATAIAGTGVITGVTTGTASITYTLLTGCITTATITVNTSPSAVSGTATVCQGVTTALADGVTGGTWLSSATSIATVTSGGTVAGVTNGTAIIIYTLASGCTATKIITVNPSPVAIGGTMNVCVGSSTELNDPSGSGTWSSGTTAIATVDGSGNVFAVSSGTTAIDYTYSSGCAAAVNVTVNPLPAAIAGTTIVCVGGSTDLTDAATGGTWSSSDETVATVGAATGVVTGISEATATITYTLPTGCFTTTAIADDCNVGVKQISTALSSANILPNPNKGDFNIIASLNTGGNDIVLVEVTDMIGKTIYKGNFVSKNGKLNEQILLGNNIADGLYLLNLQSGSENIVLHFVVEK